MRHKSSGLSFAASFLASMVSTAIPALAESTPTNGRQQAPNITGTWERYPDPYGAGAFVKEPPPPGGDPALKAPYASQWRALRKKREDMEAAGTPMVNPSTRCIPEGMPLIMGAVYALQILQNPGQVTVLAEFLTQTRRVYIDEGMPKLDDVSPSYNGYSVGHWVGDTLVIQTVGIRKEANFFDFPLSPNARITERWRLTAPDILENRVVIDDPDVLAKPYSFTYGYKKSDYRIMEYICDNNRYSVDQAGEVHLRIDQKRAADPK